MIRLLTLVIVFFVSNTFGQLVGKVVDVFGKPIEIADVFVQNLKKGTSTDKNGAFYLDLNDGDYVITISYLGYEKVTKKITIKNNVFPYQKIVLKEALNYIDNVEIKSKTKAQVVREKSFAVEVVDVKELKNLSTDVNSILGKVSGVNIRESGGVGSNFKLSLNGFTGNQVRVFIDGVPIHYFGESLSLNNFPSNLIEQIEVYKGVVPIHLSSDALGGAINVVTNKSAKSFLDVSTSVGSYGTLRYAVNTNKRFDTGLTLRLKSFFNTAKNNYKVPIHLVNKKTLLTDEIPTMVERCHDAYNSQMIWPEIGFTKTNFADELLLGVLFSRNFKEIQQHTNLSGEPKFPYGEVNRSEEKVIGTFSFRRKRFFNENITTNTNAVFVSSINNFNDYSDYRYFWGTNKRKFKKDNSGEADLSKTKLTLGSSNLLLNSSSEYEINSTNNLSVNYSLNHFKVSGTDDYKQQNETQFSLPSKLTKQIIALNYTNSSFEDKLKTSFFGKYYMYSINSLKTSYAGDVKIPFLKKLEFKGYGVSTSYEFSKVQLKASFEKALRFPEVFELFGNGTFVVANPDLLPETSKNFNLGFLFNNNEKKHNIIGSINSFVRIGSNYINPKTWFARVFYMNTQAVNTKGVDLSFGYNYNNKWVLSLNTTYHEKLNNQKWIDKAKNNLNVVYNQRFPNEPYFFGNMTLSYKQDNMLLAKDTFVLSMAHNYTHKFFYKWSNIGAVNKSFIPKQYTANLEAVYSMDEQKYNISLGIINLMDTETYDNFKQPKPGRLISCKLRYFIN